MDKRKNEKGFLARLKDKWKLDSIAQVILVLIVFACTGTTVLFIKEPIFNLLGVSMEKGGLWKTILYLLLVLPLYQIILLIYGFIFGQFRFFWEKEKQIFNRMWRVFSKN